MRVNSRFCIKKQDKIVDFGPCGVTINQDVAALIFEGQYAEYLYFELGNGDTVYAKSQILDYNTNSVNGRLFAQYGAVLDMGNRLEIVAFGLCPYQNRDGVFNKVSFEEPIIKNREDTLVIACTVELQVDDDQVVFCGGDNVLAKAILGMVALGDKFEIALGDNSDQNLPMYRAYQNETVDAQKSLVDSTIAFEAVLPNQPVYELLLCYGSSPVLRAIAHRIVNWMPSVIDNGVIPISNEPNTPINLQLNNAVFAFFETIRYGVSITPAHSGSSNLVIDPNAQLFGDAEFKFLGIKSDAQITLLSKANSGKLETHICIPNNNYMVAVSSDGYLFLYADDKLSLHFCDGEVWQHLQVAIPSVQQMEVVKDTDNSILMVCIVDSEAAVFVYDKDRRVLQRGPSYQDCTRLIVQDSMTIYAGNQDGTVGYALRGSQNNVDFADAISQAVANRQVENHYCGLYLYSNGTQYNTVNKPQLQDTGFENHRVFVCGCYLVAQHRASDRVDIVLYDRLNDKFETVFWTDIKPIVKSVARLDNYIVVLDDSGAMHIYEDQNRNAYLVRYDLTSNDKITGGALHQRASGYQDNGDITVRFALSFEQGGTKDDF